MAKLFANSGDPDQMPRLHCLQITLFVVSILQWVKTMGRSKTYLGWVVLEVE